MIKKLFLSLLLLAAGLAPAAYALDMNSPLGAWETISDKTGKPSSIVKITSQHGELFGQIERLLPGSHFKPGSVCAKCPDHFKNKPIIGLVFLWGFVPDADGSWKNGKVLDPHDGNIYRGTMKLIDQGRKMELRGYWGPFWRTQTWNRV